jgi:hypothetical protein
MKSLQRAAGGALVPGTTDAALIRRLSVMGKRLSGLAALLLLLTVSNAFAADLTGVAQWIAYF